MCELFSTPIKSVKVRKNVTAYLYPNGVINIDGEKYVMYSLSEAIKEYRKKHPIKS